MVSEDAGECECEWAVGGTLQSQSLVSADRFAVVNTIAGGAISVPFAVHGGQVFMNSAFIQDDTITTVKIGSVIQSTNYVFGQIGGASRYSCQRRARVMPGRRNSAWT